MNLKKNNIIQNLIELPRELVEKEISKLIPNKYNPYYWWRTHRKPNKSLHHYKPLLERIQNGDFDYSPYKWMAQYTLYNALKKIKEGDTITEQAEKCKIDLARYRKLMDDFYLDEKYLIEQIKKEFPKNFTIKKSEFNKLLEEFDGTLEELYYYLEDNYKIKRQLPPL